VVEHHSARSVGLLTERTREKLPRARLGRTQHVKAEIPGELVCFDSFYVGKLMGVGPVWQLTACDAASSFAFVRIVPWPTAEAAAAFLSEVVLPAYHSAGWKLQRVLSDHGNEFKADFDQDCQSLGIRHTRTKPRHCWTNGFVERLQTSNVSRRLPRLLQPPSAAPRLPPQGRRAGSSLLGRRRSKLTTTSRWAECQHPFETGHSLGGLLLSLGWSLKAAKKVR
jgi:transposase InsO family protein